MYRGKLQYLVKWIGYPHEECTWEPLENLQDALWLVDEFHERHPNAPRRISAMSFTQLPFRPYENLTAGEKHRRLFDWTMGKHIGDNVSYEGGDVRILSKSF